MKRGTRITSRIGKRPILLPEGVTVSVDENTVAVVGPVGRLELLLPANFEIIANPTEIVLKPKSDRPDNNRRIGLFRALIANMVAGVVTPFVKELQLFGTGYRAEAESKQLTLRVGYSHPVVVDIPEGIEALVDKQTTIVVKGVSKELVGSFAAKLRSIRTPDAYKGKGVRYLGEQLTLKPGKAAKTVGAGATK